MKKIFLTAAITLLIVGCSKNEITDLGSANDQQITFGTYAGISKATETTNANISDITIFGVDNTGGALSVPRVIPNLGNIRYSSSNFSTGPWAPYNNGAVSSWSDVKTTANFFAYAPYNTSNLSSGLSLNSDNSGAINTFSYTVPTNAANHEDFIVAASKGVLKNSKVNLKFFHALSQIKFVVKVPSGENLYADIAGIEIRNVVSAGTFDISQTSTAALGSVWSSLITPATYPFGTKVSSNPISESNYISLDPTTNSHSVTTVQSGDNVMLIPQTPASFWTPTSNVSVAAGQPYVAVTYRLYYSTDGGATKNWEMGGTSTFVTAGFPLTLTDGTNMWLPGTKYTYTITLGDGSGTSGGGGYNPGPGNITDPDGEPILPGEPLLGRNIMFTVNVDVWPVASEQGLN